jgi:hypothetical protein
MKAIPYQWESSLAKLLHYVKKSDTEVSGSLISGKRNASRRP